jgi:hypothetical protein
MKCILITEYEIKMTNIEESDPNTDKVQSDDMPF